METALEQNILTSMKVTFIVLLGASVGKEHLGNELDSELMVLCTSCHRKVHAQKRRKNYYIN